MSIMFAEDFKGYGTDISYLLNGLYAEVGNSTSLTEDPDPNASGPVFKTFSNPVAGFRLRRVFPGERDTVGVAMRFYMDALPPNNGCLPCLSLLEGSSTAVLSMTIDTTGRLRLHVGYGNTDPVAQSAPVFTAGSWHHIELKAPTSDVDGTYTIKLNGVTVLTSTAPALATQSGQICFANPGASSLTSAWYVKDLVVWDTLGGDNDDFMGTVQVIGRTLVSDVSFNWSPSHGTLGYPLLGNSPPIDGTDYITAAFPAPAASTFGLSQLPDDVTSVRALITQVRARKIDGGDGNLQCSLISSGNTEDGSDRPITSSFAYYEDIFEIDPHTSAPWTPVSADAAVVKINRTV